MASNDLNTTVATMDTLQSMGGYSAEAAEVLTDVFISDPDDDRKTMSAFTNTCTEYPAGDEFAVN